jgi:hypothetical protein
MGRAGRPDPRITRRDAGLRRVSGLTRWLGVSAIGLAGLLAAYVAQAKPGHSTGAHVGITSAPVPKAAPVPTLSTEGSEALAPPPQAPEAAVGPTSIASGGS